jgi:transketolase
MSENFLIRYPSTPPLDGRSIHIRSLIIQGFEGGKRGHIGSSMSLVEMIRVLYDHIMNFDPKNPMWDDRDRFILSKGHGCLALYAILADHGFIATSQLDEFCHAKGLLGGHPERLKIPGVEASTGALGHGLSIGVGIAISANIRRKSYKTFVVLGDGEINEGSVWEAALSASKHGLDNLVVLIDYNKLQSYGETREVLNLEPLAEKLTSFGFSVREVDGHNISALKMELEEVPYMKGKPSALICHTIKGKGISFAEQNPLWHHKSNVTNQEMIEIRESLAEAISK